MTVVIASGARYRRPDVPNLATFEGAGISYWVSPIEARLCAGEDVALVGGGNSAGQAVVFLAPQVNRLHLIVRETEGEAWDAARGLIRHLSDETIATAQRKLATESDSEGQRRMSALHGGSRERLEVAPNLWAGVGLVRGRARAVWISTAK